MNAASSSSLPPRTDASISFTIPSISVLETPSSGRGVFTSALIPANTLLLRADDLAVYTINREYRKEVCAQCFAYDRGVSWKLRDTRNTTGAVWCSADCESAWRESHDKTQEQALAAVEALLSKARGHRGAHSYELGDMDGNMDIEMVDTDTGASTESSSSPSAIKSSGNVDSSGRPTEAFVASAWRSAEASAESIRIVRAAKAASSSSGRAATRALTTALADPPAPGMLIFSLLSVFAAAYHPSLWISVAALASSPRPYVSAAVLRHHIISYLHLLSILPIELLEYCTPDVLLKAVDRDNANSFGIRSLGDGGSEMFGYGVWPSASYWNHACAPNVRKLRVGRCWEFYTIRAVNEGEELCITYLGGEEESLDVEERRKRLEVTWGFGCGCAKCLEESAQLP